MDYERIHKVQAGIISPSKLRMKLMGSHHNKMKEGSNSNSSRTSPSKLDDAEFLMNSLLATNNGHFDVEASTLVVPSLKLPVNLGEDSGQSHRNSGQLREGKTGRVKPQQFSKGDSGNSSSVHPVRALEDENHDYDSNASSSSFEFHKGERKMQNPITRSLLRPVSSKWNDAEKWIMHKQSANNSYLKRSSSQSQADRVAMRVGPELSKQVDFCEPSAQAGFDFSHPEPSSDLCVQSKDLNEVENNDLPCTMVSAEDATGGPAIRAVSMRDMGTEMTPIPSQEPSMTSTPIGATTPLRSPTSSMPSTPLRGASTNYNNNNFNNEPQNVNQDGKKELSDQDLKLKTRREIAALGVQLGKLNIAAWASKDKKDKIALAGEDVDVEEFRMIEFDKRAATWEEAEKSKYTARYKREEIKISAWESRQKAELEAETRKIKAQVEEMRARAHANTVKKIAMAKQRCEERRAAAEARRNREAERTAARAEYIRQTGRIPASPYIFCGWR